MTILDAPTSTPADLPAAAPSSGPPPRGRRIAGVVVGVVGLATLAAGAAGSYALSQRDDGWFTSDAHRYESVGRAITSDELDFGTEDGADGDADVGGLLRVRLEATAAAGTAVPFVGIARTTDVEAYLAGVAHDVVTDVETGPFRVAYRTVAGDGTPPPPAAQSFWAATNEGTAQPVEWAPESGDWTAVVMNADGTAGVAVDVATGFEIRHLGWLVAGVLALGGLLAAAGGALVWWPRRRGSGARTR
jgi:hypothetical protein